MLAPDGYVILTKYTYFNIAQDGKASLTDENGNGSNSNEDASLSVSGNIITVKNHPGAELPETGGTTPIPLYAIGSVLLFGAACGLILKRKKR